MNTQRLQYDGYDWLEKYGQWQGVLIILAEVCVCVWFTISVTCKDFLWINLSPYHTGYLQPLAIGKSQFHHTHTPRIFKYQANDAHKSRHVHIITLDFPLRSHNCRGASRTLLKGFMRCSLWQPVTLTGHKYYCSWWEEERGGETTSWLQWGNRLYTGGIKNYGRTPQQQENPSVVVSSTLLIIRLMKSENSSSLRASGSKGGNREYINPLLPPIFVYFSNRPKLTN